MFPGRSWKAGGSGLGLWVALTLVAASVADNEALCPAGERLLRSSETDSGGERPPASAPEGCEGDFCETPALAPALHLLGTVVAGVGEVMMESPRFAGREAPSPPTPPPKRDA